MGQSMGQGGSEWGGEINMDVDIEVERLVNNSYLTAKRTPPLLDQLARDLCERETITAEEFQMLLVQFGCKTSEFETIGTTLNREKLPFNEDEDESKEES
ncbi:hypothetical protein TrCOL_g1747 [Triparma columacea]|uniref:Uncharacterized protein n=1 Tax=Triparma columacea TaxID=722753 RepID=A0A9W7GCJ4_9STRA|nr:hypothetical protein TrCOL_g1747 [Triparma columacea]